MKGLQTVEVGESSREETRAPGENHYWANICFNLPVLLNIGRIICLGDHYHGQCKPNLM